MMKRFGFCVLILCVFAIGEATADEMPSIREATEGMEKHEGFVTFYYDNSQDHVYLEIDHFNQQVLYVNALAAGVGSNDIGLDRGQLGGERVVYFERRGPKVMLVQPNFDYRAITDNKLERESVKQAFAQSILWGFEVTAESDGRVLVDATDFLMRDAHDVIGRLKATDQGSFQLDPGRSAFFLERTRAFPQNTEFEVTLTFTGEAQGRWLRSVTPTPGAVTVRQHHSFIQLPDEGYEPRAFDPRAGYFGLAYQDYSTPVGTDMTKRLITRHRLEKKNPEAEVSEPVEPIVYYLDPGTPEPVRSALLEGARWWNQAFEAIGYKNAFRVEMLPEGADPLDVRYNVIQWVHRSTRGWSYGSSVIDPRTGEILKGHVTLGSLRVRQDYLIAEGLLAPYKDGLPEDDPMLEMALARIRQLSAHEIGHTLGLAHNFAASTNGRASVMDYPAPMVQLKDDGSMNLEQAYDTGIGEWDKVTIAYGYQDYPDGADIEERSNAIIQNALREGLRFISDRDARPESGAHPYAHLWDNGSDPVDQMEHVLRVRRKALDNFGTSNIKPGKPTALIEDALVPIYLYHRYQLEGTVKLIGGLHYSYKLRGDEQAEPAIVSAERQQAAIDAMLKTIQPGQLMLPEALRTLIPPRPMGYENTREMFNSHTDPAFDALGAAETAVDMTVSVLLNPHRAARLIDYHARDSDYPGLGELIDRLVEASWKQESGDHYRGALQRTVNYVVLHNLLQLAADDKASSSVRAVVHSRLLDLKDWMRQALEEKGGEQQMAALRYGIKLIDDYNRDPAQFRRTAPLDPPPGSPIGGGLLHCSFRHE